MWLGFAAAFLTGLTWTLSGVTLSRCARGRFDMVAYGLAQTLFTVALTLLFYLRPGEFAWRSFSILLAFVTTGGLLNSFAQSLVRHAMTLGNHGPVWAISQAALVIPFLAGVALFGQSAGIGQWAGTALIACGILIPVLGELRAPGSWLVPTLATFLLLGAVHTLFLVPSQLPGFRDAAGLRPALSAFGGFLGWCVPAARREKIDWNRRTLLLSFAMALLSLVSLKIFFLSLDLLSGVGCGATAVPLILGANILGFACYSRLVLKERPTAPQRWGMAAVLAGVSAIAL